MEIALHKYTTLIEDVQQKKEAMRIVKVKLQELISSGCLWARIMSSAVDGQDLHRIGMVTGAIIDDNQLLVSVRILMRSGSGTERAYLWSDASWTRRYRNVKNLELFTLENRGGFIQVPRMEFMGNVDGPCTVNAAKWIWFGRYNGPGIGESEEIPRHEVGAGDPAPEGE